MLVDVGMDLATIHRLGLSVSVRDDSVRSVRAAF